MDRQKHEDQAGLEPFTFRSKSTALTSQPWRTPTPALFRSFVEEYYFLGGTFISFMDSDKKSLWNSELHTFYVKAGESKTENWTEKVFLGTCLDRIIFQTSVGNFSSVKYYGIVHQNVPLALISEWFSKNKEKLISEAKEAAELVLIAKHRLQIFKNE